LSWERALGPLGGLSTGQLNCCLPHMEEKKRREAHCRLTVSNTITFTKINTHFFLQCFQLPVFYATVFTNQSAAVIIQYIGFKKISSSIRNFYLETVNKGAL